MLVCKATKCVSKFSFFSYRWALLWCTEVHVPVVTMMFWSPLFVNTCTKCMPEWGQIYCSPTVMNSIHKMLKCPCILILLFLCHAFCPICTFRKRLQLSSSDLFGNLPVTPIRWYIILWNLVQHCFSEHSNGITIICKPLVASVWFL